MTSIIYCLISNENEYVTILDKVKHQSSSERIFYPDYVFLVNMKFPYLHVLHLL